MSRRIITALFTLHFTVALMQAQTAGFLKIVAVDGEGAFNDIKRKAGHAPVVRVVDESNNLVEGAQVTFTLPMVGPRGIFPGGASSISATTDDKGIAHCPAYVPNSEEGRFNIKVTARFQGKTGTLVISQSNTLAGGSSVGETKSSHKLAWILALVGAGAAGGVLAATRGGSSSSPTPVPSTTLSAGTITVGGPR